MGQSAVIAQWLSLLIRRAIRVGLDYAAIVVSLADASLLELLEVGVIVHALDGSIRYANPAACRMLGLPRDIVLTRTLHSPSWDVVHADGRPVSPNERAVMRAIHEQAPVRGVVIGVLLPNLTDRSWLRVDALPMRGSDGALEGVLATFTDVSAEHVRAEEAQRARVESEARHASVLRAMREGVVVHEPNGAIRFANPGAERILGLTRDQLFGVEAIDPRWALVDVDGRPLAPDAIPSEITRTTGVPCKDVLLGVDRANGERAWLFVSTDAIEGPDPGAPSVVASFTDITAQRETQRALERTNERFAAVTSAIPGILYQALFGFDASLKIVFVAGKTKELTGLSPEEILSPSFDVRSIINAEDAAAALSRLGDNPSATPVHTADFRLRRVDEWRWARAHATAAMVDDGLLFTGVVLDITEERRLAAGLERAQRREVMGNLAAGMAHNFNNMLAVIQPNLGELREYIAAEGQPMLEDALNSTERAADLVRQLMRLARGENDGAPGPIDVRVVVEDVAKLCKRTFERSIVLRVHDRAPGPALSHGHTSQLHQVLLNLCLNSRDALVGRPTQVIELVLERARRPVAPNTTLTDALVVTVRDTGVGMDETTLARLGEPFFTTKPPGRGTGLGIASAMRVVREMGGDLVIESTMDVGTTFRILLPESRDRTADAPAGRQRSSASGSDFRVLVVDDEALVRSALVRMLRRITPLVTEAESGEQALATLERDDGFDLVLLDLSMPTMSGRAVLHELRQRWPSLPVVVVSGNVGRREGLEHAVSILEKPVTRSQIEEVVRAAAALRSQADRPD